MKKLISMLLAMVMLLSCIGGISVLAAEEEVTTVFNITFENGTVGSQPKKGVFLDTISSVTENTGSKNLVRIAEEDGNKFVHMECQPDAEKGAGIRLNRAIDLTGYTNLTVAFRMKSNGAGGNLRLYTTNEEGKAMTTVVYSDAPKDWTDVKVEFNFNDMTYSTEVSGKVTDRNKEIKMGTPSSAQLRFMTSNLAPGTGVYIDDIVVTTTDKLANDWGPLAGNNQVDFSKVKPEKELGEDSFVNNLKQHPRIFIRDWDEMRTKIDATYETRRWYANIKKTADQALNSATTKHVVSASGNVLESARTGRDRIQALAFVYKITGDKRYLDKAYKEMVEMGDWPDWSAFISDLVTAEILQGYACCYDWLYDDLTAEQKQTIVDILKKKAIPTFIYHYEDASSWNVTKLSINWNPVCNTSNIMMALAIADEEPEIAEYILEKAPARIQHALGPYAPQGAYPEGVSYWDYGTTFVVYGNDLMENAFVDGFTVPDNYIHWKAPGMADTCDYAIYMDGPAGRFNYGDCSGGHTSCEVMYWAADRFDKPHYAWRQDAIQRETGNYLSGYPAITSLCWYNPDNAYLEPGAFPLDKFYYTEEGTHKFNGVAMRSSWENSSALYAAMQGGDNQANHMHWSLGTYVIDHMGKRFIRVLGQHTYSLDEDKNKIYYKRAESYNTLIANPTISPDQNKMAVARLVGQGTSDNTAFGILDMTEVYSTVLDKDGKALIPSAKRGLMLTDNRSRVIVQDEVEVAGKTEFYWFANTDAGIKIAKDGRSVVLNMDGDEMLVRMIEAPADAKFTVMNRKSLVEGVLNTTTDGTKLTIHLPEQSEDFTIAVEYIPLGKGEGIPEKNELVPLANWKADDNGMTALAEAGSATVLKLDTPNAIANGKKTFVDTSNTDVVPFTQNGRTLVPVRFISESFGAQVGWDDATQAVTVDMQDASIKLQIGSNEMLVNGETVLLDVPAQTINSRTLIPLRALVEALGKNVFWDDRGLIIIADDALEYSEEALSKMITELNVRVMADGKDIAFFDTAKTEYTMDIPAGGSAPVITATTIGDEVISVNGTTVSIGGKAYTFKMQPDPFEGLLGTKDEGVATKLILSVGGMKTPDYNTFIYVESLTDSTGFESYPERGTVDGVINSSTANRWAVNGDGWLQFDFGSEKTVHSMAFAGVSQTSRAYNFDVLASVDGENWTTVHTGGAPKTTDKMSILPLGNVQARYIKMIGKGYDSGAWNTWAEVRFYDSEAQQKEDKSYWGIYFASAGAVLGKVGQTGQLTVGGADKDGKLLEDFDATFTYTIADESIATITPDGKITFHKAGTTTITVDSVQKGIKLSSTVELTAEE